MEKKYIVNPPENPKYILEICIDSKGEVGVYGDKIENFTPYTEDSAYAHGYTEAESKYREIRNELEKQAYQRGYEEAYDTAYADTEEIYESGKRAMYQKGLKDAWEVARKIRAMTWKEQREVFGTDIYADIIALSASECIEKIRQYEQKQEEQEEEKKQEKKESIIAEDIMRQYLNTFCNGRSCTSCPLDTPDFTCGRGYHFISANPISDEEVRRAYIEVRQKMEKN